MLLPQEPHEQYEKEKTYDTRRWAPRSESVQYATGMSREQSLIASERMKQLGQNGNDTQLWIYLVVKAKFDGIKNNTAEEPGKSGPWIKAKIAGGQAEDGKSEYWYLRNQWTKTDRNEQI